MTDTPPRLARSRDRSGWPIGALVLTLALALRIGAAVFLPDQQFDDAADYRNAGQTLWATGQLTDPLVMPLYPVLIALVGPGWGQLLVDVVLSVVMVCLVHQLTLAVFADRSAALVAALATALYPYFVFYAVVGLTETLFIVLLLGAFICWYRGRFTLAGVLAVLSILTRPTIDLLAPVLVMYFALAVHGLPPVQAFRRLATYVLVYVALMSPWWLHNYRAYGTFVRLDLGSGMVLYSGNNPYNQSGGSLKADSDRARYLPITDPVARERAMWNAGLAYIKENPGRFVQLAGLKLVRLWRPWPYAPGYASRTYVVLSALSFVPVLALALVYLAFWGVREIARIAPILMLIAYITVVHMVFAASMRYRLPLEPFLIMFAAVAVARLARRSPAGRLVIDRFVGETVTPT